MKVVKVKAYTRKVVGKYAKAKQDKTTVLWDFVCLRDVEKALREEFKGKG